MENKYYLNRLGLIQLLEKISSIIKVALTNLQQNIDSVYGAFQQHLKDAAVALDEKVSWHLGNTTIVLPNHGQIVGEPNESELEGKSDANGNASLVMLSKWNVADFGSSKYPINLNGKNNRPSYNDTKEIALLEDVEGVKTSIIKPLEDRIQQLEDVVKHLEWKLAEQL